MPPPEILGITIGISEFMLSVFKLSGKNTISKDRHSLEIIWLVNVAAIAAGIFAAYRLYWYRLPWPQASLDAGYCLFVLGLALRWYSIIYLGRFFTTDVTIALLIPGRIVISVIPAMPAHCWRCWFCLSFQNWACLLIIFIPCFAANRWRIHIEEQALCTALGKPYQDYMQRTKRLIPLIY